MLCCTHVTGIEPFKVICLGVVNILNSVYMRCRCIIHHLETRMRKDVCFWVIALTWVLSAVLASPLAIFREYGSFTLEPGNTIQVHAHTHTHTHAMITMIGRIRLKLKVKFDKVFE